MGILSGYKTYVACGLAILGYVGQFLVGDIDLMTTVNSALPYLVGIFLRQGMTKI